MNPRPPARAADTELIRRVDAEWRILSHSRWMRDRLATWAVEDDRLAFDDGDDLVSAARRRDVSSWAERDQILAAILGRPGEPDRCGGRWTRFGPGDRYGHPGHRRNDVIQFLPDRVRGGGSCHHGRNGAIRQEPPVSG